MKKLSTWLIIAGIVIFLIPVIGTLYANYQQEMLYREYLADGSDVRQSYDQLEEAWQELPADSSAGPAVTAPAITTSAATAPVVTEPAYKPVVLGRIRIPKIDENLHLVEGVTSKDLKAGAGHIPGTAMPGEIGNCAIAGHRNYTFGSFFNRLDELEAGDLVTVEYGKNSYTYQIYEQLVVLPEDTSVLNQSSKDKVLTLITCTPIRVATHRLIYHALLVE